jgi:hypothetical protein
MGSRSHKNDSPVTSERLGRQIFSVQRNHGTRTAFRIVDLLDVELEIARADDAVAELLSNSSTCSLII